MGELLVEGPVVDDVLIHEFLHSQRKYSGKEIRSRNIRDLRGPGVRNSAACLNIPRSLSRVRMLVGWFLEVQ